MAKKENRRDYDGRPLREDEILVKFPQDDLFVAENVTNKDCLGYVTKAGKTEKTMSMAVPKVFEREAKSQLNLVQNENLGHYRREGDVYFDGWDDESRQGICTTASAEDIVTGGEELKENRERLRKRLIKIIELAPKVGCAMVMIMHDPGLNGARFAAKMHLERSQAAEVRQYACECLRPVLKYEPLTIKRQNRSRYDNDYRTEAYRLLEEALDFFG